MRVLVLCLSQGHGGLELYAAQEIKQWQSRGHQCIPVVSPDSMLEKHLSNAKIDTTLLSVKNKRLPILAARQLARLIDEQEIDLIHIHWNNDLNLAVLAKIFSQRQAKVIYSRHMAITRSKKDLLHRWFYHAVDRLILMTKCLQQEAMTYLPMPASKISQLYLGVAAVEDQPANYDDCYSEQFPRRKFNVALFGRIEPYKGQHLLVSAIEQLVADGMDVSASIIGHVMDNRYFAGLEKSVTKANLSSHISFESFVNNPAQRMKCYDAIILTTTCETFGLVLLEAMRAGIAVIGTRCGGVPEIIADMETGLLFAPGNVKELAEKIAYLYRSPDELKRLAMQGKQKADEQFSETMHFEKLEGILKEVCES